MAYRFAIRQSEQSPKGVKALSTLLVASEQFTPCFISRSARVTPRGKLQSCARPIRNRSVAGRTVTATPEADTERTTADGKTSAVHFLHFAFTQDQIAKFRTAGTQVILGIAHHNYGHMAVMPEPMRAALAADFSQ